MSFTPLTVGEIVDKVVAAPAPFRVTAFDGSTSGPQDAELTLEIVSPNALAHIVTAPGDLGLARAYITGSLRVTGDHPGHPYLIFDHLQHLYDQMQRPTAGDMVTIVRSLKSLGAFHFQPVPEQETVPGWKRALMEGLSRHSKERDKEVVSRHYDVGNDFYELFLGDSMAYTCAYYPADGVTGEDSSWRYGSWPMGTDVSDPLTEAQDNKHRLVFDKLGLEPGERLLDVGCGWGGMVRYAARHGVKAVGVTLSQEQYEWGKAAIEAEGLGDLAEVRCMDYRDVPESDFDAVSAIGILEHVGVQNYQDYFTLLFGKLRPGGRMLNHCVTRPHNRPTRAGQFIDRYIFPDGELTGSGRIITFMQDTGFDVVHEENLRPHYQRTLHDWCELLANRWDEAVELVGEPTARLFGLYMAGSEWGFEHNVIQLHQVLAVKPDAGGYSGVPVRQWWMP
ncbi:MAG TPA: cyclopropane-fatty-acyl-phospholipid synthase family protein [Candidatus Corynebacterium avicola]|uniref:Cyclopropane-fatty-acyl-phospholipid synthase family protein n=1 Tax=Candidatus Corynebacterium avicola TaxID=2838527 RepID=A0A9D1ULJ4_9CORY|nr:cyclopropane-fatty-acyl-phospholipid synthase family protein [Candidatus Corynebacterium avicola]